MASFLTQCPGCMTSFRVSDAQMEAAAGMVRCGACLSVFSAPANRITLRTPVDPTQVPVLAPDAELDRKVNAAGYDVLPADVGADASGAGQQSNDLYADEDDAGTDLDSAAQHSELWIGDANDRDVPLGDLDLDFSAHEADADEFDVDDVEDEDDEEDEDDDDDDETVGDDDYSDDEEPAEDDEPAYYGEDLTDDEQLTDDEDLAEAEEFAEDDNTADAEPARRFAAAPLNPRGRAAGEHVDKRELREYLAALEDDDALEPLHDYDLDGLSEPVTFNERHTVRRTLRCIGLVLLNLVLIAVLLLQYVNANLDSLTRSQRLAPLMNRVCQVLECPLPEQSDPGSLSSQDLLVRSHPRYAGVLEVSFIFRNDSPDAQPFPAIELAFSDAANELIANRLFQPADYLPPELHRELPAMPGQQTLQITLELADPGSEAVNYSVGFRAP